MLIKRDGNLQKRHYTQNDVAFFPIFCHVLLIMFLFADHEHVFWQTLYILHFENNYTMLHFSAYHDSAYCSWKDLFELCVFCIFAVYGRHGTVENVSRILEF